MAMFDTFRFAVPERCLCGAVIASAQSKDGPCDLLLYDEGGPLPKQAPVDPRTVLLPEVFELCHFCEHCGAWHEWRGFAVDGAWVRHATFSVETRAQRIARRGY